MSKTKPVSCESIVPQRGLRIQHDRFACPYCARTVRRGGKAEGFRKAGFASHVAQCWEILLFQGGYLPGPYSDRVQDHIAIPLTSTDPAYAGYIARRTKAIRAHIRKRKREQQMPRFLATQ